MDPLQIIAKYYQPQTPGYHILVEHSRAVANLAVEIARQHPELNADAGLIYEAAMLHDIGIFKTHAPDLYCHGKLPYICHGYLGREILEEEGFPKHALVCERHTGTGLPLEEIVERNLPIPRRNMMPQTIEEQIICYADKFFSKSGQLTHPKATAKVRKNLLEYGAAQLERFDQWHQQFEINKNQL